MTEKPDYDEFELEPNGEQPGGVGSSGFEIALIIVLVVVLLSIIAYFALNATGVFSSGASVTPIPTSEPTQVPAFIEITSPLAGAVLEASQPITARGRGGGLFEDNVVVQAFDQDGNVLAEGMTTINAADADLGGIGTWSLELIIETAPGTAGVIIAFSTSPEDGSLIAYDQVEVTYGQDEAVVPDIKITVPADGATVDVEQPLQVAGIGRGLFDGNIVVRAVDGDGEILAEETTTIDAVDARNSGEGPWSLELTIESIPGTAGSISAFSPSPEGGDPAASDEIKVTYGEAEVIEPFVTITGPKNNTTIDVDEPVLVEGDGGGLFEGSVIVRAFDEHAGILAEEVTAIDAPDSSTGGEGSWSVELTIATIPGTTGKIIAFSPSPVGSDPQAIDAVDVVYGTKGAYITITSPGDGQKVNIEKPVLVKGMGGGLFEGNVVVRAADQDGNALTEEATIVDSPDAGIGGQGPWSLELTVETTPGTTGMIIAFSPSPMDGSLMAADQVEVTYGGALPEEEIMLEDHLWLLAELNGETPIDGTNITLQFEGDEAGGSAGCNDYFTPYERTADTITFGDVGRTRKACQTPIGVMEQENQYFAALDGAATYSIDNEQLNILNDTADQILVLDPAVIGTITGPEGSSIPENALISVKLNDVSLADAPAITVGEQVLTRVNGFPVSFAVTYDPQDIEGNHTYAISVRIEDSSGDLLFINTSAYQVITRDSPSQVEVVVDPVGP
jgi:putative lipoprotein